MSGIAVRFHRLGGPVKPGDLWAMLAAIPYRAPDGAWVRIAGAVGMGVAKLTVTPEEVDEAQPLVSLRTGAMIAADVRIDNRPDLITALPDPVPASISDAALVLRAYETWGASFVDHLLGDFAVVIWDPLKQRIVCARDTSGQRGLFYRVDRQVFAAASEIHQLFQDPSVPIDPNEDRIRESLTPHYAFQNEKQVAETYYAGIWAIPPGHLLTIDAETMHVTRYWTLEPREIRYRTDDAYAEHLRDLLSTVIASRMRSVYPVGALLSGGLDSTSVVATAQQLYLNGRIQHHRFVSFSSVFDGLECDERSYIQDLQAMYGFEAHYIPAGGYGGRLQLQPPGFLESPHMGVAEGRDAIYGMASGRGVRVMLSGHTADACVSGGRLVFDSLLRQVRLRELRQHVRAYRRVSNEPLAKIVSMYGIVPLLPVELQKWLVSAYIRRKLPGREHQILPIWMNDEIRGDLAARHLSICLEVEKQHRFASPVREMEYRLLYPPEVARYPTPWPLVLSNPFADRRLHEFLLAIPTEQKFRPHPETDSNYAGQKYVLRAAMRGVLPESIRTRTTKTAFTGAWESEIASQWPLYEAIFQPPGKSLIAQRGYIDAHRFWDRLQHLRAGNVPRDFAYVMLMIQLENWLRAFGQPRSTRISPPPPWQTRHTVDSEAGGREVLSIASPSLSYGPVHGVAYPAQAK